MHHRFRFSTSGNPTKHMPIGYLSLWVQPRSVTSGDLSWPFKLIWLNVKGHIQSCIDINLINYPHSSQSHHANLRLLTISLKSCRRLFLLWRHNFVTWPDSTNFVSPKVAQKMPHKLCKISARFSKRCGVQLRKTHGEVASTPLTGRGLHDSMIEWLYDCMMYWSPTGRAQLKAYYTAK